MPDELSDAELVAFKQALVVLKHDLAAQVRSAAQLAAPVELDQGAVGRVSRVDAIAQQQMAVERRRRAEIRLVQVHAALLASDEEEYGWCRDCGDPIGVARLRARPESPFCMTCTSGRER